MRESRFFWLLAALFLIILPPPVFALRAVETSEHAAGLKEIENRLRTSSAAGLEEGIVTMLNDSAGRLELQRLLFENNLLGLLRPQGRPNHQSWENAVLAFAQWLKVEHPDFEISTRPLVFNQQVLLIRYRPVLPLRKLSRFADADFPARPPSILLEGLDNLATYPPFWELLLREPPDLVETAVEAGHYDEGTFRCGLTRTEVVAEMFVVQGFLDRWPPGFKVNGRTAQEVGETLDQALRSMGHSKLSSENSPIDPSFFLNPREPQPPKQGWEIFGKWEAVNHLMKAVDFILAANRRLQGIGRLLKEAEARVETPDSAVVVDVVVLESYPMMVPLLRKMGQGFRNRLLIIGPSDLAKELVGELGIRHVETREARAIAAALRSIKKAVGTVSRVTWFGDYFSGDTETLVASVAGEIRWKIETKINGIGNILNAFGMIRPADILKIEAGLEEIFA